MKKNLDNKSLLKYSRQIVLKNVGVIGQKKIIKSKVATVVSNNPRAVGIERASKKGIDVKIINQNKYSNICDFENSLSKYLLKKRVDLICLAGFMKVLSKDFVKKWNNKIINIHPALLPKYGGKGMFGMHVHNAVVENKETETGITIHYVNKEYDKGNIIFQAICPVSPDDSPEDVAKKVHELEYEHFPKVIEKLLLY